ncbi:MAG: M1 family metallopeptidase [Candidatus Methanofastidiosia archaeon]|jgi:hypothetical protein
MEKKLAVKIGSILCIVLVIGVAIYQWSLFYKYESERGDVVSHLFDTAWDDYTLFYEGLTTSETPFTISGSTVYHIDVTISHNCLTLQGHQDVLYTNREDIPLEKVYFRLFPNITGGESAVSEITIDNYNVEYTYELNKSALCVNLPDPIDPGENTVIRMDFTVNIPETMGRNYRLFGYIDDVLSLNEFYPVIPVYDDETWNIEIPPAHGDITYYDASLYLVRVTAPTQLKIVTSGIEVGHTYNGRTQMVAFVAGPARGFYIAASRKYTKVSKTVGETTINSYSFPKEKEMAEFALQVAVDALNSYNNRIGVYPYTEFDIVSTSMWSAGMEYPGIVAISTRLYDPSEVVSGLPAHIMMQSVVAHETAHQWFYNVVGNDQIDEPWLDEAIVQYLTSFYYLDTHGEASAQLYIESWKDWWGDVSHEDIPVGLPSGAYTIDEYGPIVYGRGPLFVYVLADEMGQEIFNKFLRQYYMSYKWGIGTGEEFKRLAEEYCQCDLTELFDEWVY